MIDGHKEACIAGFYVLSRAVEPRRRPLIFLHGSGQTERSLVDFSSAIASDVSCFFPRGKCPVEGGFSFFNRKADFSIDPTTIETMAEDLLLLVEAITARHGMKPLLIGYSSGAVISLAILATRPDAVAGAALLRPQRPFGNRPFPGGMGMPILLISAQHDARRKPEETDILTDLLTRSNFVTEVHHLPCGHDFDPNGRDHEITRAWLTRHR